MGENSTDDFPLEVRSDTFQKCAAVFLFLIIGGMALLLLLCVLYPAQFPAKDNFAAMSQKDKLPYYAFVGAFFLMALQILLGTFRYRLRADEWGVTQCSAFATNRASWAEIASYRMEQTPRTRFIRIEPVLRNARGDVILRPCAHPVVALDHSVELRARFWQTVVQSIEARRSL